MVGPKGNVQLFRLKLGTSLIGVYSFFMFFLMARKSNMVPVSVADFGSNKQLPR